MTLKTSIFDFFKKKSSSKKFFYEIDTGIKKNHKEIINNITSLKSKINFKKKKILCILPNSIQYIEYFLSVISSGGVFIPIPYFTERNEVNKIIKYVKPHFIVSDKEVKYNFSGKYINVQKKLNNNKIFKNKNGLKDLACIYYSSGTTGSPKGIMYSHQNMISLIKSIVKDFKFTERDRHLALLPFGHTASINYNILPALLSGSELFISKGFDHLNINFFKILKKYKISYTQIVPSILFILNKMNINLKKNYLKNLKFIGCGSSYLPVSKQIEFIKKYKINVANLYGLSETGPTHIDDPRNSNWSPGSIGKPLSVNKFKLDKNSNILIKGKNVFVGYYRNKKQYRSVVKNGWFNTGDIGKKINNKYYFMDRSKDLIIKNGINIVPGEIEEAIYKSKKVLECCVVGIKDEIQGEEIAVAINPLNNQKFLSSKLIREIKLNCKKYISNYKIPKYFFFITNLPKTASGKIMRKEVRTLVKEKFE